MNFLESLYNAFRLPELRNKILFTGLLLIIFRAFANISIPQANTAALQNLFNNSALLGLLDLFSGGGLRNFSVVAMGLNPYINATIIMQLMTVISVRFKEMTQEGEIGRRKFTRYSRYLTVALALGQAYGYTVLFQSSQAGQVLSSNLDWQARFIIMLTLTAGTVMLMWFGELITEYGIGNGISLMIFAGIIGRGPATIFATFQSKSGGGGLADYLPFIIFAVIALAVTAFIIEVHQAVRKIPIQSAQRIQGGSRTIAARASFLPMRVNTAGVIPIIFAISIMFFPTIVANYLTGTPQDSFWYKAATWIQANFVPDGPNLLSDVIYNLAYFGFIFAFTYFYTFVTWQPDDVADNLKRTSTFIPGIRPGRPTADYLTSIMNRITFFSGIYLGLITVILPLATSQVSGIPHTQMYLGGTAILIVVGVALDTMKQLETQLVMRQYRGFIRT
jgi:preprotein translocase subunit SecY